MDLEDPETYIDRLQKNTIGGYWVFGKIPGCIAFFFLETYRCCHMRHRNPSKNFPHISYMDTLYLLPVLAHISDS